MPQENSPPDFRGIHEATFPSDGRLHLPSPLFSQAIATGCREFWLGPLPAEPSVLALVPANQLEEWAQTQAKMSALSPEVFLRPYRRIALRSQARIGIPHVLQAMAGIRGGQILYLLGTGHHIEIWRDDLYKARSAGIRLASS